MKRAKLPGMTKNLDVSRLPIARIHLDQNEIIVDHFAGGGGASSGVSWAAQRSPDIAINHDPEAIAMHMANHPSTKHYLSDIWEVDPVEACASRPVGLMWLSPTCQDHSRAKGTALDESSVKLRALADVGVKWAKAVRPRIICLENVPEWLEWGPLYDTHSNGCSAKWARVHAKRARNGEAKPVCKKKCHFCKWIPELKGTLFEEWKSELEKLGYKVEWRILRACDYGAPTTRKRVFLVARCDGKAIAWPEPTHAAKGEGGKQPHRTAAECIDWSVPTHSIFERDRPLAEKTLARIARGIQKFVLDNPRPFIVPTSYGDKGGTDIRVNSIDEPIKTICGNRSSNQLIVPYLVHRSNGERPEKVDADGTVHAAQAPRIYDIDRPIGTIMAHGLKHALSVAILIKNNGGNNDRNGNLSGQELTRPIDTIACKDQKSLTVASLVKMRGTSDAHIAASGHSLVEPMPTVSAGGTHMAAVAAFLVRYNGEAKDGQRADDPMGTQTTKPRFGLVTVMIQGEEYILADVGMRMLTPRELFNAQGFDADYEIEPEFEGKPLTKTAQIRCVGNSVPPQMADVIARAQLQVV